VEAQTGQVTAATTPPSPTAGTGFEPVTNFSLHYRFLMFLFSLVYWPPVIIYDYLVFGLRIEGRSNLRRASQAGCILVSNHSLYLDPAVLIHTLFPRRAYYFALKSHFRHPLGGPILRLMGGIPVPGRSEMRTAENTMRQALELGYCVHLFPEGEMKHLNQEIAPFKGGAFYLAARLGVPVVPITLVHRPRRVFGRVLNRRFIRVRSVVGEPVEPLKGADETDREAAARIAAMVHRTMVETISAGHRALQG
jgi:1-acyl-sn-glycerol-3-phosphate acyltransferase